jgi:hypothetical protein
MKFYFLWSIYLIHLMDVSQKKIEKKNLPSIEMDMVCLVL